MSTEATLSSAWDQPLAAECAVPSASEAPRSRSHGVSVQEGVRPCTIHGQRTRSGAAACGRGEAYRKDKAPVHAPTPADASPHHREPIPRRASGGPALLVAGRQPLLVVPTGRTGTS
jgi:hypothetical protein